MGMFEPASPEFQSDVLPFKTTNILDARYCPSHVCCLYKACLAFRVLRVTTENFGLHSGNKKFDTKSEE